VVSRHKARLNWSFGIVDLALADMYKVKPVVLVENLGKKRSVEMVRDMDMSFVDYKNDGIMNS
jgi:hypothetical protein